MMGKPKNPPPAPKTPEPSRITQWGTIGLQPMFGWTVGALGDAVNGHNSGTFGQSGRLWEDMRAHPWIGAALAVRREFQTTCPRRVTPAGRTETERADNTRCADFIREVMPQILPTSTLSDLFDYELGMGGTAFGMDWEQWRDGGDTWWLPIIKPWDPTLLNYRQLADERSIDGGAWLATTMSHGLIRVDHGGGRWGLVTRRGARPYLGGLVRMLGEAFVGDGYNFRDNMSHQDRWGRGIVEVKFPDYMRQEEALAMSAGLNDAGGGGTFLSPQNKERGGVELQLHRADGAGYQTFDATEKRILRRIMISILRQDMTTVGNTGIAENDPRALSLWECRKSDVETWGDAYLSVRYEKTGDGQRAIPEWKPRNGRLREAIWKWIAYYNFGDMSAAPYVWWDATPPDDWEKRLDGQAKRGQQRASTLQSLTTSIKGLKELGVNHDPVWLAEQCGVSMTRPPDDETAEILEDRDIEEIQVRISAAGHPFVPGHTPGINAHGLPDPVSKVRYHLAQAKHHASAAANAAASLNETSNEQDITAARHKADHGHIQSKNHANQAKKHADRHGTEAAKKIAEQAHKHAEQAEKHAAQVRTHTERLKKAEKERKEAEKRISEAKQEAERRAKEAKFAEEKKAHEAKQAIIKEHVKAAEYNANKALYHSKMAEYTNGHEAEEHALKAEEHALKAKEHANEASDDSEARKHAQRANNFAENARNYADPDKLDKIHQFFGENDNITIAKLARTFSANGHFDAYPIKISSFEDDEESTQHIKMELKLMSPDGRHVGYIDRTFTYDGNRFTVKHDHFEITDPAMQGTGAAKDVFRKSVDLYLKTDIEEIKVEAGLSAGRYVWASYGFTAKDSDVRKYKREFAETLREAGHHDDAAIVDKYTTIQQIADHVSSNGEPRGKNWLLNIGDDIDTWDGKMKVKHGDPGFERLKKKIGYTN